MQEDLELAEIAGDSHMTPRVRRLHLVVTALREFFASFEICMKKDQTTIDSQHLLRIKGKNLFIHTNYYCYYNFYNDLYMLVEAVFYYIYFNYFNPSEELGQMVQVRQLFLLLIRMYHPGELSINYLQDLIVTNHRFLITQEAASPTLSTTKTFNIVEHVKQ